MRTDKQSEPEAAGISKNEAALGSNGRACSCVYPVEAELRSATRALRVLLSGNQAMMRASDEICLYQDICTAIIDSGGYLLAWIGLAEDDARKSVRRVAGCGAAEDYLDGLEITWGDDLLGNGPVGQCIRFARITVVNDAETDPCFLPWREKAACHGCKAIVALPLFTADGVIGSLNIYAPEPEAFRAGEIRLLKELAADLSYGIESRRVRQLQARTEEARSRTESEYRTIFDSTNDAIFVADFEGRLLEVNQAACQSLGYTRDELLNMNIADIDAPESAALLEGRFAEIRAYGKSRFESVHVRKDGTPVPVEINVRAVNYHQTQAVLGVARDISERKRAEAAVEARTRELERARAEAEKANRAKSQFLANMSHEIRTPMYGILGTATLLLDMPLAAAQRELAETILGSAEALLALVNEVLDFSRIEAGKLAVEPCDFDLVACVSQAADLLAVQAHAKGLEYRFEALVSHCWVSGDAVRIRQIVLNLLANAIKFTSRGSVTLRVASGPAARGQADFSIAVQDTGIGIAAGQFDLLFRHFTQLDSSLIKKHEGAGLGLAISRRLAELMGGSITVESEPGHGSRFCLNLSLPLVPPRNEARAKPVLPLPSGAHKISRRVLLVEDNAVNRKIGVFMLEKLGCQVDTAVNGREAVDKVLACSFDVVLMDCGMPEMDGITATREIRSRQQSGPPVPIVALTAHALGGTREQCLQAGMDDFLAKPVTPLTIERMLRKWTAEPRAPTGTPVSPCALPLA